MLFDFATQDQTEAHAAATARALDAPCVFALRGPLGAGKTTWVRAFLRALGHDGVVPSPTYTLVEPYEADGLKIWHVDLYRLQDPLELEGLGVRELLDGNAVMLVEWPERWLEIEARSDISLDFRHGNSESARQLEMDAASERGQGLLERAELRKMETQT